MAAPKPARASAQLVLEGFTFTPSPSGSEKAHRLSVPLSCRGTQFEGVVRLLSRAPGGDVIARFSCDGLEAEEAVRAKLTVRKLTMGTGDRPSPELDLTLAIVTTENGFPNLLRFVAFLMTAAGANALDLDAELEAAQLPLPFPTGEDLDRRDPLAAAFSEKAFVDGQEPRPVQPAEAAARDLAAAGGRVLVGPTPKPGGRGKRAKTTDPK
jgi:hypothetical protein